MTRGEATQIKVHFKGQNTGDDYVIFAEDSETIKKWKADKSVPLAHVVQSFKIFTTHKQGASGTLEGASDQMLDSEFGTKVEEDVIKYILEHGEIRETEGYARNGPKNDSRGGHTITR